MLAIIKKEISAFFAFQNGFLIIGAFLTINGLFLWVFKNTFNIYEYGNADLSKFSALIPWSLIVLIPLIAVQSFFKEKNQETLVVLLTKPISVTRIIVGKFLGTILIVIIALIPTLLYPITIYNLSKEPESFSLGLVACQYFSVILLSGVFMSISMFISFNFKNQITAFITTVLLIFLMIYGIEFLRGVIPHYNLVLLLKSVGLNLHFDRLSQGHIAYNSIAYFISIILFFTFLTIVSIKRAQGLKNIRSVIVKGILIWVTINLLSNSFSTQINVGVKKRDTHKSELVKDTNSQMSQTGLININNHKSSAAILREKKIEKQKNKWQLINIGLPIIFTLLFRYIFNYIRKRKYEA